MAPTPAAACRFAAKRSKMTNALDLLLAYPHGLIVTGTVLLILGLTGLALFSPSDIESTEDSFSERPKSSDKETQ
jgi:hypothetical protein